MSEAADRLAPLLFLACLAGCVKSPPAEPPSPLIGKPYITFASAGDRQSPSLVVLGGESRACLTGPTPSEMRFRVKLPHRALLTFAIGIKPFLEVESGVGSMTGLPSQETVRKLGFAVRIGEDAPAQEVFRRDIHLARSEEWLEQAVDLHRFSGKEVWLSFETTAVGSDNQQVHVDVGSLGLTGLFAEPVLHDRDRYGKGRALVLISIDTLRRDHASVYGYQRRTTPGLEDLAWESIVFDDAVSTSSWTLPAHASLLTSLYPSYHGAVNLHRGVSPSFPTLPALLKENGFFTQAVVTHLYLSRQYGFGHGFHRHTYLPEARAKQVTDRAIQFLIAKGDDDFFLFLHYYDPHWHYDPPPPYHRTFDPTYDGSATGIWWDFKDRTLETIHPRDLRHIVALYDGEILYTDRHLARLFREMKRLGVFDKAMVVVASDHGEEFLEHGGWEHQKTLYEEQIRIPLLIKLPGSKHRGRRVEGQVGLIDVAPTVIETLGLPVPPSFQGRSLLGSVEGSPENEGDRFEVWSETEHTVDGSHKVSLRRGGDGRKFIFSLAAAGGEGGVVELYHLAEDPGETRNQIDSETTDVQLAQRQLDGFLRDAWKQREAAPAMPVELTAEQLDKLRALGYAR